MADTAHREELSCASAATLRLSQDGASSLLDIAGLMIHQIQWTDKPLSHVPAWHSMLHSIYIYIDAKKLLNGVRELDATQP